MHLAPAGLVWPHSEFIQAPLNITEGGKAFPSAHTVSITVTNSRFPSSIL